jgi:epoxyqueuosine reductase
MTILDPGVIKQAAYGLGADLCGIAPIERFSGAPEGFRPTDVFPECRSVVVIAMRFLKSTLYAKSTIPYTYVRNEISSVINQAAIRLAQKIEDMGALAVTIGAIGKGEYDRNTDKFRGPISLRHAAELAGLGRIGKNTLLVNEKYGNMIWLNAVLTSAVIDPDPPAEYETCPKNCRLCIDSCPAKALDGVSIDQRACLEYAFGEVDGGEWRIKCFKCRKICPNALGLNR